MLNYQQLIDVGLSPDAETLQARLSAVAEKLGFGLSSATHIRGRLSSGRASVHAVFNTPPDFLEASRSTELGQRDPFLGAVLASPGCHAYDESFYRQAGADELWGLISAYGYKNGIAYSIHETSHLEVFSFGLDGTDRLPMDGARRLQLEASLMLVGLHAYEAAKRLWTAPPEVDLNAVTGEEISALNWARDGVCVWVAGDKLVYSNPGLVKAQARAARKLGTSGPGALLRAIEGGLIEK